MDQEQLEMWPEEVIKGYRLHQKLLAKGEKPDTRPWGGMFEKKEAGCSIISTLELKSI